MPSTCGISLPVRDYDLAATMSSGQVFAWERVGDDWCGVVNRRWVKLRQEAETIVVRTAETQHD